MFNNNQTTRKEVFSDQAQNDSSIIDVDTGIDAKIPGWKAQYKDVYELSIDEEVPNELSGIRIICRAPGRVEMSRFIQDVTKGDALKAQNNFFFGCLLYPDVEVIRTATDQKPGLVIALSNKLNEITGLNQNFTIKKL